MRKTPKILTFCVLALDIWDSIAYNDINNKHITFYTGGKADREIAPLVWYINTGRASTPFLKKLIDAKPFMVARKLHMGGSDAEILDRIKAYIG